MAKVKAAKGMNVEVLGDKELQRRFKALEGVGQADILEAVLHAVAEPIRDAASSRAPRRTGKLAENIIVETLEKRKDECVVGIGPSKDVWYGIFPELGTSHSAAKPYLRPSFDERKGQAKQEIGERLWDEIERAAKK
ncbi:HK97-gp10 family putative phage morphogenesis protein [Symbiobacterium thermophilum]|uniref:Phage protein, HK97 gp10 family n=1 Tax=Symbiobacterium thermophilum TaxID=2734 RepID=A0A953IC06_SYMTR|nr:HK97-gp10 family putative phage morphogenesis protein [Symbiobacterium thermophilum]MBY6275380.1 hypothetical protein [Symbiobacterium thermophilum]